MSNVEETIIMPKALTAENGAKYLLSGEFYETVSILCEECGGEGEILQDDGSDSTGTLIPCEYCDSGLYQQKVTIGWTTIKEIYAMCAKHLQIELQKEETSVK